MSEQINAKKIEFLNAFIRVEEAIDEINEIGYLVRDEVKLINMWFDRMIEVWKELDPLLKPGGSHAWQLSVDLARAGETVFKDTRYWSPKHGNRLRPYAFILLRRAVMHAEYQCDSMIPRLEEFRRHIHTFLAKTPFQRDVPPLHPADPSLSQDKLVILKHLNKLEKLLIDHRLTECANAMTRGEIFHHHGALITAYAKLSNCLLYVPEDEREKNLGAMDILPGARLWDARFIRSDENNKPKVTDLAFHLTRKAVIDVTDMRPDIVYLFNELIKAVETEIWG